MTIRRSIALLVSAAAVIAAAACSSPTAPKGCDVITIDVEGSELEVLRGAEQTLRALRPIVFVSVHPEFMRERWGQTPDDLLVQMEMWDYIPTYLGYDHEQHWIFKPRPR